MGKNLWKCAGTFCIASEIEGEAAFELPYPEVGNVHILDAAICAFKKSGEPQAKDSVLIWFSTFWFLVSIVS